MQYIRGMESYHDPAYTAITLGKFDGLHRGHLKLVERVQSYAGTVSYTHLDVYKRQALCREKHQY